eukprot:7337354-Prymnesium_polylepis.1
MCVSYTMNPQRREKGERKRDHLVPRERIVRQEPEGEPAAGRRPHGSPWDVGGRAGGGGGGGCLPRRLFSTRPAAHQLQKTRMKRAAVRPVPQTDQSICEAKPKRERVGAWARCVQQALGRCGARGKRARGGEKRGGAGRGVATRRRRARGCARALDCIV